MTHTIESGIFVSIPLVMVKIQKEDKHIGLKLKIRRTELRLKQKDVAKSCGITQQYLAELESERETNPSKNLMGKLADALNSSVQELFF